MSTEIKPCCLKKIDHEGAPEGAHKIINGLSTYQVGEKYGNKRLVVIFTDVFGNKYKNVLLVADQLSKLGGFHIMIPDILENDPIESTENFEVDKWLLSHSVDRVLPIVNTFLKRIKTNLNPEFIGGIGYCFGAPFVLRNLYSGGLLDAGALAHPSLVTIDEFKAIKKPLLMSFAEHDKHFPIELRGDIEKAVIESGADFQINTFHGVHHGFAVRGDPQIQQVKYALEKTIIDQFFWFDRF